MQGTILILDGVSTNRIMLKVQLSAAWYHVVQAQAVAGLMSMVKRTRPDLILCAMTLPDGDVIKVQDLLGSDSATANIPIIAFTRQNDRKSRLRALAAGVDDVLCQPCDDVILMARIRSLLRTHSTIEDLRPHSPRHDAGFSEAPQQDFAHGTPTGSVALVVQKAGTGAVWRARLSEQVDHRLELININDMQSLMQRKEPDVLVVELCDSTTGLRLLADLRARGNTRNCAVIAVPNPANAHLAADALDRGADDVMPAGFCPGELALRIETLMRRKTRADRYRASLRDEVLAAYQDPMTGLHNRRYALPALNRIIHNSVENQRDLALMLVDLDHFKSVNDTYGHAVGDAVLIETANRLQALLRPSDLIARIGGEEFLIALPATPEPDAVAVAKRLCRQINTRPFAVRGIPNPLSVTTSIGVCVVGATHRATLGADLLMQQADRALYQAKHGGRNQVSVLPVAA